MKDTNLHRFCVAPMMGCTTPHARYLYRLLSKKTYLFTEMIAAKAILYSKNNDLLLKKHITENPVALQVGSSDPEDLSKCAKLAEEYNFDEINLNVGCPSKAVQKGRFGVCLMKEKELVKDCLLAMKQNSSLNISMKCRLGVDEFDSYNFFEDFLMCTLSSGIEIVYVHARKALLKGYSPKNNRTIPNLNYDYVYRAKEKFPNVKFILNGGINTLEDAININKYLDGVMVGRLVQSNPFILTKIDNIFYNKKKYENNKNYSYILKKYFQYIRKNIDSDSIYRLLSPLLNIFFSVPNAKKIKSAINYQMQNKNIDKLEYIFSTLN